MDLIGAPAVQYNTQATSFTPAGMWASIIDEAGYAFIVLVDSDYSTRLASTLLNNMKTEFYKNNPGATSGAPEPGTARSEFLAELAGRYNDPLQWDKLSEAQHRVDQVKLQIQDNLKKITANRDQMMVPFSAGNEDVGPGEQDT